MVGLGIAIGPVFSAALTEVSGWRSVFWVIGAAAVAVLLAALRLAESRKLMRW
jgi:MFS family permease